MKWYINDYEKQLKFILFTHFTTLSSIHNDDNIVKWAGTGLAGLVAFPKSSWINFKNVPFLLENPNIFIFSQCIPECSKLSGNLATNMFEYSNFGAEIGKLIYPTII